MDNMIIAKLDVNSRMEEIQQIDKTEIMSNLKNVIPSEYEKRGQLSLSFSNS